MSSPIGEARTDGDESFKIIPLSHDSAPIVRSEVSTDDVEPSRPLDKDPTFQRAAGKASLRQTVARDSREEYLHNLPFTD